MVNATMAPPTFTVPGFQTNMNQLQMLHAMQQVQAQQQLSSPLTCNPMKQSAFNFVSPSHIRATRDVVSALQQCPDLLAQPDFAFMRDFIREARCMGVGAISAQQSVAVLTTPMLVPLTEAAPLPPMRACPTHLTVETSMNDDTCSPNSQMDVDINALLQALDINDEFSSSSSTSSDPSTPATILTTSQFPTTPTTVGIIPQQLPVTTTAPVVVPQAQTQQVTVPQQAQQQVQSQAQGQGQGVNTCPNAAAIAAAEAERQKAIIDPRKYKTRMCRNWLREGRCSYEHTCCFAHGEGELRNAAANITVLSSLGYFTAKQQTAENGQPVQPQPPAQQAVQQPQGQNQRRRQ